MAYVFGDTFICADKQAAQAVTFNKNIGVKSVTLEGDVYDPSGTLSGGAAPNSSGILVKVQELRAIETQIQGHKAAVDEVSRELANAKKVIDAFRKDKRDLDIREHEVKLLEEQVGGSNATKVFWPICSKLLLLMNRSSPKSKLRERRWPRQRRRSTRPRKSKRPPKPTASV
jgi:structural maintenance of chromosome 2